MDEEEEMLVGQIQEIKKEKDFLTSNLPSLRRTNSDDDLLSTDDGSLDDVDTSKFLIIYFDDHIFHTNDSYYIHINGTI